MFEIVTGSKEWKVVYPAELGVVEAGQFYQKKVPSGVWLTSPPRPLRSSFTLSIAG